MTTLAHHGHAPTWSIVVAVGILLAIVYVLGMVRARPGWPAWRTAAWLGGCAVVAVAGSPLVGPHSDPRMHMASHLLLGMVAPLGLVLAAPVTLLLRASPPRVGRAVTRLLRQPPVRVLAHPVSGLVLSVGGLYVVMLTSVYAWAAHDALLHQLIHLHYLAAGCLLTWSLVGPDPAPHRAGMPTRVAVLIAAAAGHAVLAKHLYASAERMAGPLMTDPRTLENAAMLMYYGADVAELLLAAALFGSWYSRRGRRTARSRAAGPTPQRVTP